MSPIYEFFCEKCNLVSESFLKEKRSSIVCDHCKGEAKLQMSVTNFKISRKPVEHIQRGDADRYIGQDAEKRWKEHEDRKKTKTKVLKERVEKVEKELSKKQKITDTDKTKIVFNESQKITRVDGKFGEYK